MGQQDRTSGRTDRWVSEDQISIQGSSGGLRDWTSSGEVQTGQVDQIFGR